MSDEPRSTAERYGMAIRSSHLRANEHRGDVDYMIAAGWLRDGLGALLYRLRTEFDLVRAQVGHARQAENPQTELLLILVQLKTLRETKEALGRLGCALATKQAFMVSDAVVAAVVGRVLDAWLDPNCRHCDGRGFNGGTHRGEPRAMCRPCRGTGHRRDQVGQTVEERRFAGLMFSVMEQATTEAEREIRRAVSGRVAEIPGTAS